MLNNLSNKVYPGDAPGGGGGGITFSGGVVGDVMIMTGAATIGPVAGSVGLIPFFQTGSQFGTDLLFNYDLITGFIGVGIAAAAERLHVGENLRVDGRVLMSTGAAIASANDITLGVDGNSFHITGNTTINRISVTGWRAGTEITLILDGIPQITDNVAAGAPFATILVDGHANFLPVNAGCIVRLYFDGTSFYLRPIYTA